MAKRSPRYIPENSNDLNEKFINYIMQNGKKSVARRIFNDALKKVKEKNPKENPQAVFEKALSNVAPMLEVRPKRVGGAVYQVPIEVPPRRKQALAMRWILTAARSKKGSTMSDRLAAEFIEAGEGTGAAVKKKEDMHRMAEANRAFAHFARY